MYTSWFRPHRSTPGTPLWISFILVWIVAATLLPLHSRPAYAADIPITIAVPQFDNTNILAWQLNKNAVLSGNKLELTSAKTNQVGTAFYKNRASLANDRSFSAYFVMEFTGAGPSGIKPNGADGIVFTIQTQSSNAGSEGGGIGYEGITPSVGIEFDTWENRDKGDNNDNHVGFNVGGIMKSVETAAPPNSLLLQDNTWHTWVDYNGATKTLEVRMNTVNNRDTFAPILSVNRELRGDVGQDVFIGFTAATGSSFENHNIISMYFHNAYRPIDTRENTYTPTPSKVELTASPSTIGNNGTDSATITATVSGPDNKPLKDQTVTFSTNHGTLSKTTEVTDVNGKASVTLTGTAADLATIRGTVVGGVYGETTVTIQDVIPPVAPVITGPTDGSTLTNARPPITGTAEPGSTVTVKEGSVTICTAVTDANGTWSCTPTSDLSAGLHTITATATDAAGNTSPPTTTTTFTIDATAPALPVITNPINGSFTRNQRPPITGTAEPGSTVTVKEGSVTICTAVTDANGTWSCTPTSDLSAGLHTITATATDAVGNTSPATTTTFTIDTTAPALPLIHGPANGSKTDNPRPSINGTAEPGSTVTVKEGSVTICTAVTDANGTWSCTPTSDLSFGLHMITATATDDAGNTSPPTATTSFRVFGSMIYIPMSGFFGYPDAPRVR